MLGETLAIGGIATVGALFARWVKMNGVCTVPWSDISQSQLEAHQKLAIAMADRAHLDPACRELLRHQVKLLRTVGIVGKEIIDVTPEPNRLQEAPTREVEWVKTKNGMRRSDYGGDRTDKEAEGFGLYARDAESSD